MASIFRMGGAVASRPTQLLWRPLQLRVAQVTGYTGTPPPTGALPPTGVSPPTGALPITEEYFSKNQRLGRPLSPHLSIYKLQLTSMLSISHRATGVLLSSLLSGFGIGMLVLPASYPYYVALLSQAHYGAAVVFTVKFCMAFPFLFHAFNGVRHLAWDLGYGFTLRTLYKSGYGVTALALLSALAVASY